MTAPVSPTREDPLAGWASVAVGGPLGRRAATPAHRWWTVARVLLVAGSVTVGLAVLRAQHCRVAGWTSPGQFVHACYSDVAVLTATAGGSPAAALGLDPAVPGGLGEPVLSAALLAGLAGLAAWLAPVTSALTVPREGAEALDAVPRVVFDLYAVVAVALLALTVLAVAAMARGRPWDAALVALSPVVVLAGLVNVDLPAVALGACAAWAWSRDRPVTTGLLLGLAVAARLHVALLAVALLLLALRSRRWRPTLLAVAAAVVAWSSVNLPLALLAPQAWWAPVRGWWLSEPGYGSSLQATRLLQLEGLEYVAGLTATASSVLVVVLTLLVVVAAGVWVQRTPNPPSLPVLVLVLLVGSLLVAKAVPVQASLWLLPWAALAVPRWRDHTWWWAAEALYTVAIWQYLVSTVQPGRALPAGWLVLFVLGRLAAFAYLAVRASARPQPGPVAAVEPVA